MAHKSARVAHPHRYEVPTREILATRLAALATRDDAMSRSESSAWAMEYLVYDDPQIYPKILDSAVHDALVSLSGADTPTTDRPFLYGPDDFRAWRDRLLSAPGL